MHKCWFCDKRRRGLVPMTTCAACGMRLADIEQRMKVALDDLHVVRVELEHCSLRRLAKMLSTHLVPIEDAREHLKRLASQSRSA